MEDNVGFSNAFTRLRKLVMIYMAVYTLRALSGLFTGSAAKGAVEFVQAIEVVGLALLIAMATSGQRSRRLFLQALFLLMLPIALYTAFDSALLQLKIGESKGFKQLGDSKYTFGYLGVLLVSAFFSGFLPRSIAMRLLLIPLLVLVVFSGERSAWLGIFLVVVFFFLSLDQRIRRNVTRRLVLPSIFVAVVATSAFAIASQSNEYIKQQTFRFMEPFQLINFRTGEIDFMATTSPSNRSRLMQLSTLIGIMKDSPLIGVGTDGYLYYAHRALTTEELKYYNGVHGEFWFLLAENGIFTAGIYLGVWLIFFLTTRRLARGIPTGAIAQVMMVQALGIYGSVLAFLLGGGVVNLFLLILPMGLLGGALVEFGGLSRLSTGVSGSRRVSPPPGNAFRRSVRG